MRPAPALLAAVVVSSTLAGAARLGAADDEYPKATLSNNRVSLTVYLPDAKKGFYRGSRFDWSGVVGRVAYAGHTVFGPWKDAHDPANHDDILGPVEEFGTQAPLGYADAKEGETFLKIGVGELVKPREEKYRFYHNYRVKYPGEWEVSARGTEVEFKQALLSKSGYGYRYTKRVELLDPGYGFVIRHELTNSGTKDIDTDHYNHNFFNVDGDPVGPNYRFFFPAAVRAPTPKERFAELVTLTGKSLQFTKPLDKGSVFAELDGLAGESGAIVARHAAGVSLTIAGDVPFEKVNFWATTRAACPEPFIRLKLKPGQSKAWAVTYTLGRVPKTVK